MYYRIGSLSRLKSPIRTRSRESEKSDKSLSEPSNSLYESYRKKESEIIFDSDIEQIGTDTNSVIATQFTHTYSI